MARIRVVSSGKLPILTKNLPGHSIFVIRMDYLKDTLTDQVFLKDSTVTRKNMQIEPPQQSNASNITKVKHIIHVSLKSSGTFKPWKSPIPF